MERQIEKVDEKTYKVNEDVTLMDTYSIDDLISKKKAVEDTISRLGEEHARQVAFFSSELQRLDALILDAKSVGVEPVKAEVAVEAEIDPEKK